MSGLAWVEATMFGKASQEHLLMKLLPKFSETSICCYVKCAAAKRAAWKVLLAQRRSFLQESRTISTREHCLTLQQSQSSP